MKQWINRLFNYLMGTGLWGLDDMPHATPAQRQALIAIEQGMNGGCNFTVEMSRGYLVYVSDRRPYGIDAPKSRVNPPAEVRERDMPLTDYP